MPPLCPRQSTAPLPGGGASVSPSATARDPSETAAAENYPPHLKRYMRKLLLVAGKEFREPVPENTFEDFEDGRTRRLTLSLRAADGQPPAARDWLQFDAHRQEIYGL